MNTRKNDPNNLAIIGASGTGKTVLATGLYATSTPEFSVSAVGDASMNYLDSRKTNIQNHEWPAATNEQEFFDLLMHISAGGKKTNIVFREYMGERMDSDPNYIRDVIGTPKAAMILFNPGMPGLKDSGSRNKMISKIKEVVNHLEKHRCSDIAFVVTASDRLSSDLEEFRDEFEKYVSEVTNYLRNSGLNWRRFDVTVSGELSDQNHPELASGEKNTAREPFLWLLDRIHARIRREKTRKAICWAAGIVTVAIAACAIQNTRSSRGLARIESDVAGAEMRLADAWKTRDMATCRTGLNDLQKLAATNLPSAQKFGSANRENASRLAVRLKNGIDLWGVRLLALEYDDYCTKINKDPTLLADREWAKKFDDALNTTKPALTNAVAELLVLRDKWEGNRPDMEKKWQTAKLGKEIEQKVNLLNKAKGDKIPQQLKDGFDFLKSIVRDYPLVENRETLAANLNVARTNALSRYCTTITAWNIEDETPPIAGPELKQKLQDDLAGKISDVEFRATEKTLVDCQKLARAEWDAYQLPKQSRAHEAALRTANANPVSALKSSLQFLGSMTNRFPTVSQSEIQKERHAVERARREALSTYANLIASKWNEKGKSQPEFDGEKCRATLVEAVTQQESSDFILDLNKRFNQAKQQWKEYQKELVERFVRKYLSSPHDVPEALNEYMTFREENLSNPNLNVLDSAMVDILERRIDALMTEYNKEFRGREAVWLVNENKSTRMQKAQIHFNELKKLCLAMGNALLDETPVKKTWVAKFADRCVREGGLKSNGMNSAFQQTFQMTGIDVRVDFTSTPSSFIGLSLGTVIASFYWNEEVIPSMLKSLIDVTTRTYTFTRGDGGKWWKLWEGNEVFYFTPWTDASFTIAWEDRLDFGINVTGQFTRSIWRENSNSLEYSGRFFGEHANMNTAGTITVRLRGTFSGPDLNTIYRETRK